MSSRDSSGAVDHPPSAMNGATTGCTLDRTLLVTTSGRPTEAMVAQAQEWAERLGVPVVERHGSVTGMVAQHQVDGALVIGPAGPRYHEPSTGLEYFFHPGMAKVRLHNCRRGHEDPMLRAMALQPGGSVLDCTLGRGTDAVIAAWKAGPEGRVVGIEKSRLLAELTIHGLCHYVDPSRELTALLRRIEARCADYQIYLPTLPDACFDVVYFDPIFDQPLQASQAMAPLRALADASPLSPAAVTEARRVARQRVVIKQRKGTPLWAELGVNQVHGSPTSPIEYGIIPAKHT